MPGGPPSFEKFWQEVNDESPFPQETSKEFRRRVEKELNLLERLAEEWDRLSKNMDFGSQQGLERDLVMNARVGLDRIRRNGEAEIIIRRKKAIRANRSE